MTAVFSEAMDTATMPVLAFAPGVDRTLTLNTAQSGWTDADTFVAKYNVADTNVRVDDITIDVSGAKDVTGQPQEDFTPQSTFSIDTQSPTVITLWPMDNAAGVAVNKPLVIKFSEGIQKGVGYVRIKKSIDNSLVESIAVTSVRVAITGELAGIAPSVPLAEITGYYVQIDSGAFKDLANNVYAGIGDKETWNFTTGNQLPTLDAIPNPTPVDSDAGPQTVQLTGITAGTGETQTLEVTAASSNASLVPTPGITYTSPDFTGTLTWLPTANETGTAVITVTVRDAGPDTMLATNDDATFSRTFAVTVTPSNRAPTDLSLSKASVTRIDQSAH